MTEDLAEDHQQTNSNDEVISMIDAAEIIIFHINDSGQISKVKGVSKSAIG